jgi:hypothetical protein
MVSARSCMASSWFAGRGAARNRRKNSANLSAFDNGWGSLIVIRLVR